MNERMKADKQTNKRTNKQTKIVSRKKERNGRKFLPFVKAQWPCRIFHPKNLRNYFS